MQHVPHAPQYAPPQQHAYTYAPPRPHASPPAQLAGSGMPPAAPSPATALLPRPEAAASSGVAHPAHPAHSSRPEQPAPAPPPAAAADGVPARLPQPAPDRVSTMVADPADGPLQVSAFSRHGAPDAPQVGQLQAASSTGSSGRVGAAAAASARASSSHGASGLPVATTSSPSSVATVRQHMVVLSCRLQLHASLDADALRAVLQLFHERTGARLSLARGHVAQRLVDGITAYFGYPVRAPLLRHPSFPPAA